MGAGEQFLEVLRAQILGVVPAPDAEDDSLLRQVAAHIAHHDHGLGHVSPPFLLAPGL
jgi:hypothetical protein